MPANSEFDNVGAFLGQIGTSALDSDSHRFRDFSDVLRLGADDFRLAENGGEDPQRQQDHSLRA